MDDKLLQIITMGIEAFASVIMTYFLIQRNIRKNSERFDKIDRRLDAQDQFIRSAVVNAGIGVAWGEKAPFVEVVKSILLNLWLHENGNTEGRLKEVILGIPNGLKLFNSIKNEFLKENKDPNPEFYQAIERATWGLR
jgi:hypothetical protein